MPLATILMIFPTINLQNFVQAKWDHAFLIVQSKIFHYYEYKQFKLRYVSGKKNSQSSILTDNEGNNF